MSKYFGFVNGEAHDFVFKKHGSWDHWKAFYLGEHFICHVIAPTYKPGWTVIVHDVENLMETPSKVEGFVSRHAAIDYALMVHPKTRDTYLSYRKEKEMFDRMEERVNARIQTNG